jgi:hypothetical protein
MGEQKKKSFLSNVNIQQCSCLFLFIRFYASDYVENVLKESVSSIANGINNPMRSLVSLHEKYIFSQKQTLVPIHSFIIIIIALYVSNSSTLKSFFSLYSFEILFGLFS